jgi:hypothetical protein
MIKRPHIVVAVDDDDDDLLLLRQALDEYQSVHPGSLIEFHTTSNGLGLLSLLNRWLKDHNPPPDLNPAGPQHAHAGRDNCLKESQIKPAIQINPCCGRYNFIQPK